MIVSNKKVEELLSKSRIAFENAKAREDIKVKIIEFGYDEPHLDEIIVMCGQLNEKYEDQKRIYGESEELTARFNEKLKDEKTRYMNYRKIAKKVFSEQKSAAICTLLGIATPLERSLEGFVSQANLFYKTSTRRADIMAKLAKYAITAEKLEAGITGIGELKQVHNQQQDKGGTAERATRVRDDAYRELNLVYATFVEAGKIVLKDTPQLREVLGILERSAPIRKKKETEPEVEPTQTAPAVVMDNTGLGE